MTNGATEKHSLRIVAMTSESAPRRKYRVKVGFSEVLVECSSKEEAIQLARKKLSSDMPRLYDVIQSIEDKKFDVQEVQPSTA